MIKLQNISNHFILFVFPSIEKMYNTIETSYFIKKKVQNMVLL
jgi:hypothetical protein